MVSILACLYKPLKLVAVPMDHKGEIQDKTSATFPNTTNRKMSLSSIDGHDSLGIKVGFIRHRKKMIFDRKIDSAILIKPRIIFSIIEIIITF